MNFIEIAGFPDGARVGKRPWVMPVSRAGWSKFPALRGGVVRLKVC